MLFAFIISFIFSWWVPSERDTKTDETYQIIFIQGTIINKNTGATLARGAKLSAKDKVSFKTKDAKAVILSTTRGRFVMTAKPTAAGNEFIAFVNDVVSPLKTNSKLSTRGIGIAGEKGILDMSSHFGKLNGETAPKFAILGEEYSFKVNLKNYPMNAEKVLAIYYEVANKKVGRKIAYKGDVATLSKNGHFTSKGVDPADVNYVQIRPYDLTKGNFDSDIVYASFKPIFINKDELKSCFQDFLSLTPNFDEALKDFKKSSLVFTDEQDKMTKEKEVDEKVAKLTEKEKKQELLFFFMASCYGNLNEDGVVDIATFNVDGEMLENWLKENNL
jgi:hypothetical protein